MKKMMLLCSLILSVAVAPDAYATSVNDPAACAGNEEEAQGAARPEMVVINPQGVPLGQIVNLVVDTELGKVAYALIDTGGSQAMKDIRLVPVNALWVVNGTIILDMDTRQLANAPMPETGQGPEEFHRRTSEYFGVAPYWEE